MEIAAMFPGFRFSPTDVELISHYLKRKIEGLEQRDEVIGEVDICKYEPWDLPAKCIIPSDHEWFFFSPSGRKYPNGSQARRATNVGFWKATGKERFIRSGSNVIGTKRTLVFHIGRAPKGERTDWITHEYCMKGHKVDKSQDSYVICRLRKKQDFSTKCDTPAIEPPSNQGSPANAGASASSQVGNEMQQLHGGVYRDGRLMECRLNKQTSRLNSPVEPADDPLLIQPNEIETQIIQDSDEKSVEDDCFTEILKDDIVNLEDMSLFGTPVLLPTVSEASENDRNSVQPVQMSTSQIHHPLQGTAYRRIRLEVGRAGHSDAYRSHDHIQSLKLGDKGLLTREIQLEVKGRCRCFYRWKMLMVLFLMVVLLFLFLQVV